MIILKIERDGCISCGQCWGSCPEFFIEDPDDGRSSVSEERRIAGKLDEGSAPDQFEGCLREAEEACPAEVIQVSPIQPSFD
ncbi:ferredoxin [Methanothrix harundinacea]|jgi:ferredoxin|uniref:Ferredoxin n=1 Tax=Methanothrix harundinacea (strain 6Ac) TaxID=1110509 RepID=G7WP67_METH6|nr:ferredoxin [Methanothrix harundinacea]AET64908.1 Ferredoxin [Methanothrix harundinacea 6Ac]